MLVLQAARKPQRSRGRIGLAIAGGGPIGGMYELGALRALDEAIEGFDPTHLEVYVGVSSGSFIAAGLANGLSTAEMYRIFITGDSHEVRFRPGMFLKPAVVEYARRAAGLPGVAWQWWRDLLGNPAGTPMGELFRRMGGLIPTGLFDNAGIEHFLQEVFTSHGRSNDFRQLEHRLIVVAADLDSGEAVRFGSSGWDDVPISRAIQASAALPGLYPPVDIRGRHFVDGALRRTMNASVVLDHGIDLMIGINPLVPVNTGRAGQTRPNGPGKLSEAGLPAVLSQTFRMLLQSRMQVGLTKYAEKYPLVDQMVLEPDDDDGEMFFTNIFSYSSRKHLCENAFRRTLDDLRKRRATLGPILERHGLRLRDQVLDAPHSVADGLQRPPRRTEATARLHRTLDRLDRQLRTGAPARKNKATSRAMV